IGGGAGSYQAYWAKHGSIQYFVKDAHSLYLQSLGELGVGGLLLVLGFLGAAGLATRRRLRAAGGGERAAVAAIAAVAIAFAFGAIAALAVPLLAQTDLRASQQAAARGNTGAALRHALDARGWQPWASSTQLQVALAQKDAGQLAAARGSIAKAIKSD